MKILIFFTRIGSYNLLEHNCNNFSNDLASILVGKGIPSHIIDLPKEIMNTLAPIIFKFKFNSLNNQFILN